MLLLVLAVSHFQNAQDPSAQLAFKARRIDLTTRMQLGISSASEAEKSAVMATTDQDSKAFADQAREASAQVEREYRELDELLKTGGTQSEKDLLGEFSKAFAELRRVDEELLSLAVKNTNLKAYSLAFGPAANALDEMNDALSRIIAANGRSPDSAKIMLLAFGAQVAALRIQTLLAPHIAEESDPGMDRLEASISKEDAQVHHDLDGLQALPQLGGNGDLATAVSSYAKLSKLRTEILALSRENTNVRSLAISLNQKRRAMLLCEDALSSLRQAIASEPEHGAAHGRPVSPR